MLMTQTGVSRRFTASSSASAVASRPVPSSSSPRFCSRETRHHVQSTSTSRGCRRCHQHNDCDIRSRLSCISLDEAWTQRLRHLPPSSSTRTVRQYRHGHCITRCSDKRAWTNATNTQDDALSHTKSRRLLRRPPGSRGTTEQATSAHSGNMHYRRSSVADTKALHHETTFLICPEPGRIRRLNLGKQARRRAPP